MLISIFIDMSIDLEIDVDIEVKVEIEVDVHMGIDDGAAYHSPFSLITVSIAEASIHLHCKDRFRCCVSSGLGWAWTTLCTMAWRLSSPSTKGLGL